MTLEEFNKLYPKPWRVDQTDKAFALKDANNYRLASIILKAKDVSPEFKRHFHKAFLHTCNAPSSSNSTSTQPSP